MKSAKSSEENITMVNPKNHVIIVTNGSFKPKWEQLGFVVANNLTLLKLQLAG